MATQISNESGTFDPAAWLTSFTAAGGGYALVSGRRIVFIADPANKEAATVIAEVTGGASKLDAVRAVIQRRQNGEKL